ncbi:MAG: polyisoprenoid-binding protein [Calditrichaeota bacterium]|nr:polyisoprenoid-binding protein [Calditrichota bacterium]MCB9367219.1 polyisoprenoid-binding protein [Calditrichota bacterium]MCB9391793.1 polyisoprenoid-binding protein [Calditrichota bacterium]
MKTLRLLVLVLVASASTSFAYDWTLDKVHSSVGFGVKHLVVSTTRGEFKDFEGTASFDPANLSTLAANFTVQVGSIDTKEEKRDEHLKGADFFDAEKYPTITFVSKKAEQTGPGKAKLTGDMTMHGVTKEVTFDIEGFNQEIPSPWGGANIVGGTAKTTINRQDFGVSWNKNLDAGGVVVGDEVQIEIELELNRPTS